jgi:ABC-2 type transport system permease protein
VKKLALLWLLPILVWIYAAIANQYPYYEAWDSSRVYTLDALIVGSGQVPDHLYHPNMVPLVLYRHIFLPVGKILGIIPVTSILEMQSLSNPYLPFAETAQYLIGLGALFALIFLAFMYLALLELLAPYSKSLPRYANGLFAFSITALALSWRFLPYMFIWVRYETIGIAMWAIALYATVRAAQEPERRRFILIAGFFSGAAVLSKVQLAGGVAVLPFLYGFLVEGTIPPPQKNERWVAAALAFGVFALLASVHGASYAAFRHNELPLLSSHLEAWHFFPIAPAVALLFSICVACIMKWAHRFPLLAACAARMSWFAAAFCLILLLSLLLGTTWHERTGVLYLTYIYSFMFGQLCRGDATEYAFIVGQRGVADFIQSAVWKFFALFAAMLAVACIGWFRAPEKFSRSRFVSGLASIAITVISVVVLIRPAMRKDGMMHDAWIVIAAVIVWRMMIELFSEKKMFLFGCIAACLAAGYQVFGLTRFHVNSSHPGDYVYNINKWKSSAYGGRDNAYTVLMQKAYPSEEEWMAAFSWSNEIAGLKLLFSQSLREAAVPLGETMLAVEGGRFGARGIEKIGKAAKELSGALIVPLKNRPVLISVRADMDFYLIADAAPSAIGDKARPVPLVFATGGGLEAKDYLVYSLSPGLVNIEPGGEFAAIALKHHAPSL